MFFPFFFFLHLLFHIFLVVPYRQITLEIIRSQCFLLHSNNFFCSCLVRALAHINVTQWNKIWRKNSNSERALSPSNPCRFLRIIASLVLFRLLPETMCKFIDTIKAILTRLIFSAHGLIAIYRVVTIKNDPFFW